MLTREQLQGVLLSRPRAVINITKDSRYSTGYCIKPLVQFRGEMDFLLAIERTLLQYEITPKVKRTGDKLILSVSGKDNLYKLLRLVPNLPDANGQWETFRNIMTIINKGEHQTQAGLDFILKLKGLL